MIKNDVLRVAIIERARVAKANTNQENAALFWVGEAVGALGEALGEMPQEQKDGIQKAFAQAFLPIALCEGAGFCNASQLKQAIEGKAKKADAPGADLSAFLARVGIRVDEPAKPTA
jgi:hypothetical protein